MKVGGRHIGRGLSSRVAEFRNRLARVRYFRGHGVHSPYVYTIVREVFMRRSLLPGEHELYERLRLESIAEGRAIELQNLAIHCGYRTFGLNRVDGQLCVVTCDLPCAEVLSLLHAAEAAGATVVVLSPCASPARRLLCYQIVAAHRSTTVDNRAYLLIFNNHLPKQHFCL